jgi:hypothetical protein
MFLATGGTTGPLLFQDFDHFDLAEKPFSIDFLQETIEFTYFIDPLSRLGSPDQSGG